MNRLSTELLVIGGGATGLGIAWDACLRGFKVVVIEQSDLAQGTSGRYHGLLHSGARYAVTGPSLARECAGENVILRKMAPAAIEDTGGFLLATPADPVDFPDTWLQACRNAGVPAEEVPVSAVLRQEPHVSPRISRAFQVQDASLDSFDLLHLLRRSILNAGGQVLLRHRLKAFIRRGPELVAAEIEDLRSARRFRISFEIAVNAAGPWAPQIADLAGLHLPLALGKGTMLALASRPVHSVLNRCRPPSDGDIIVPVGTVAVLGTTDVPVSSPEDLEIESHEIDTLLSEAELLVPGVSDSRALRAWAGVRPLLQAPDAAGSSPTRKLARAHAIIDHEAQDGLGGFISVLGGKLTTFRLMAEETLNLICERKGRSSECRTHSMPLDPPQPRYFRLPARLEQMSAREEGKPDADLICECEFVRREDIKRALTSDPPATLDDLRRDVRLGMGPCQAGFCALRAADLITLHGALPAAPAQALSDFARERWKGMRPVAWGHTLEQMELMRRLYIELVGLPLDGGTSP